MAVHYGQTVREGDVAAYAFPQARDLARAITEEGLDLEGLAELPDEEAIECPCGLRGVGRWSAEYVLLRGLGRTHVFPGDGVGARKNLQRWLNLVKPLDYAGVHRTVERWRPYGGLVYFHLLLDRLEEAGFLSAGTAQPQSGMATSTQRIYRESYP